MSFMEDQRSKGAVDQQLQIFVETEVKKQQFQELVYRLTNICWDICSEKLSFHLSPKVEKCLVNCVDRFINASYFITNRLNHTLNLNNSAEVNVQ